MAGQSYASAASVRDELLKKMGRHQRRKTNGTALERLPEGGWGIVILLDHHLRRPLSVPSEMDGVPIRVEEFGPTEALA